jgi:hypothetical protein
MDLKQPVMVGTNPSLASVVGSLLFALLGCGESGEDASSATGGIPNQDGTSSIGGSGISDDAVVEGGGGGSGAANTGGTTNSGGSSLGGSLSGGTHTGGAPTGGSAPVDCGTLTSNPFADCQFAWGAPSSGNNSSYLDFVSTWIGDEANGGLASWSATATNNACGDCTLVNRVASTNSMLVFYTYFIGFQACRQGGFCDCNTDPAPNLCSDGAQWIRDNRAQLVRAYGEYARVVYARSPNKPVIWWLEGDFVQYSYPNQSNPLSYAELGSLARDITCAIKSNQPNAVVAMNHSPWISNEQSSGFWGAQPLDVLDLVWVQGPGNSDVFLNSGSYNATTANYAWLHQFTGKNIMAETSYAGSGVDDRWTTTTAANIDARIANGVIAVLVNSPPSTYQTTMGTLGPGLASTCQ